jgi:prolipoprotein diacylglyceryltransferase
VWTPLFGLATRDLDPARAGVASGVLDTLQEFGSLLATAVLGAVLAGRLGVTLPAAANDVAATLPEQARQPFLAGMAQAAHGGIEVGAGQAAAALPANLPPALADQLRAAASHTFAVGFTDAMRPTMIVPICVVVAAAIAVLFVPKKRS